MTGIGIKAIDGFIGNCRWAGVSLAALLLASGAVLAAPLEFEPSRVPEILAPLPFPLDDEKTRAPVPLTGELQAASKFLTSGDPAAAERIARQVTDSEPENPDAWFMLGLALANMDKFDDALDPLTKASALYKVNPLPLVVKGDILVSLGRMDDAEAAYQSALDKDRGNWAAQEGLGTIAEAKGDLPLAAERFAAASVTAPASRLFPKLQLARLALLDDDPERALSILSPLAEAGHRDDQLSDLLARAYLAKGNAESAKIHLSDLVASGGSVYGYVGMARVVLAEGNGPEAVKLLSAAIRKWPADKALTNEYGNVLGAAGRYADALAIYDILLAEEPDNISLLRSRLLALLRLDRRDDALETARTIVRLDAADAGDLVSLGSLQESSGDTVGATASYQEAIAKDPQNWVAQNNLASLLVQTDPARAVTLAEQAAALAPDVPAVRDTLAWAVFKAGDAERAGAIYDDLVEADATNATYLYRSGLVQIARGDDARGKELVAAALAADPTFKFAAEASALLEGN